MNATHYEEADLLNGLAEILAGDDEPLKIKKFKELIEHTRKHFANEERLMQQYGFMAYAIHKSEHERVLALAIDALEQYKTTGSLEPIELFVQKTIPGWLYNHIATMDAMTAMFLAQNGYIEAV